MGGFLNRFGIRIATILGCMLCSAALAAGSFVNSVDILYITFSFPFGIGASLIYVTATVVATHYFNERRSVALGFMTGGQGLGTMILGPTLQALVDVFDWRNTFRVFAGALFLASLTGWFLHQGTSSPNEREQAPSRKFRFNLLLLKSPFMVVALTIIPGVYAFSRMVPYVHLVSTRCHVTPALTRRLMGHKHLSLAFPSDISRSKSGSIALIPRKNAHKHKLC